MPKAAVRQKTTEQQPEIATATVTPVRPTGPALSDLAGMDEARAWGESLARDLNEYRAKRIGWEEIDRGCVFHGPPGTGKTTFAKALAAECGVPLFITSYSDWMQRGSGHQGDVIQAIAAVFEAAQKDAPCIIFIDELDSIPARRSTGHNPEWYNAITNSLLAHLDGAVPRPGVVVVGACNSKDNLDPALTRPGRLERFIEIPRPSIAALGQIIRYHLKADVASVANIESLAVLCQGKSGAEVEQYVRSARRLARRQNRPIFRADVVSAIEAGFPTLAPEQERRIAIHEAGQAVCALKSGAAKDINVSLISRSTELNGSIDPDFFTRSTVEQTMMVFLAGRAAEEVILGEPSAGAGGGMNSDLARATELAFASISDYGLSPMRRLTWFGNGSVNQHLHPGSEVRAEIESLLDLAYSRALDMAADDQFLVEVVATALIQHRALTHRQLVYLADLVAAQTH